MTTVAYRAGLIAADTGMSIGETRIGQVSKIARGNGLAGGAGSAGWVVEFLTWFAKGEKGPAPTGGETAEQLDRGMIIRPRNLSEILVVEPSGVFPVRASYYVLGTGREIAIGVFFKDGTAIEAVQAAMLHDHCTWGEVESFKMSDARRMHRRK